MKSSKGMTLVSLLVYIIVLTIVIGTVSMLMRYFYRNENETIIQQNTSDAYSRFLIYITDDVNSGKINNVELVSTSDIKLVFSDGIIHEYQFTNQKIYNIVLNNENVIKKIELCSDIDNASFSYNSQEKIIGTSIIINDMLYNNNFYVK